MSGPSSPFNALSSLTSPIGSGMANRREHEINAAVEAAVNGQVDTSRLSQSTKPAAPAAPEGGGVGFFKPHDPDSKYERNRRAGPPAHLLNR